MLLAVFSRRFESLPDVRGFFFDDDISETPFSTVFFFMDLAEVDMESLGMIPQIFLPIRRFL